MQKRTHMPLHVNKKRHVPTIGHHGDPFDSIREAALSVHIGKHADDIAFLNDFEIPGGGIQQDLRADLVHHTWKPLAGRKDPAERTFSKHGLLRPTYGHVVPNIRAGFLLAHAAEMVLHPDTLDGGFVLLQPEQFAKLWLFDKYE